MFKSKTYIELETYLPDRQAREEFVSSSCSISDFATTTRLQCKLFSTSDAKLLGIPVAHAVKDVYPTVDLFVHFPFRAMKRLIASTAAAVLSIATVTPAFAYITRSPDIEVQTSRYHRYRPARRHIKHHFGRTENRPTVADDVTHYRLREVAPTYTDRDIDADAGGVHERGRDAADVYRSGRDMLRRSQLRRLRRFNRQPKAGHDRYRVLNLRQNKRSIRAADESARANLPDFLVMTGGPGYFADRSRPSKRSIRNDRDRLLSLEIEDIAREEY